MAGSSLKIRRALLTVSDKDGIVELGRALAASGTELVATGRTAQVLKDAGLAITPIEQVSGSPEAFQGRMKTLSFPVCSGILYRRGDASDEKDLASLKIQAIDCVVVNFYPFEAAVEKGLTGPKLIDEIDIGGPTLVRAAAKNAPDVLVLTSPRQYGDVISALGKTGAVPHAIAHRCAAEAWDRISAYDSAIQRELGGTGKRKLRYGENPHQTGLLEFDADGPIAWDESLTKTELSYNNILDLSSCYALASDLKEIDPESTGVVVVKHNNPCGVAMVPKRTEGAQKLALLRAWEGDPVSAFGGVLAFTDPIEPETATWLAERFVELVAAPELAVEGSLSVMAAKRKNLKAVRIRRFGEVPRDSTVVVPGGRLHQSTDVGLGEKLECKTQAPWLEGRDALTRFGIAVCRALKSNALAIVREFPGVPGSMQLVGAGQGQPNRVEALEKLAVPRAQAVLRASADEAGFARGVSLEKMIGQCILVSDAFFPFRDTVDTAHASGIRYIVQPGGSIKDAESVQACDEHGISMVFTGVRHFRH